jgi:magnesium and cobalt transporter
MSDEESKSPSWLERLSQALLREPRDREQLVELLRDAQQRNLLDEQALTMIEGVLQVSDMQVRDIMVPRAQMVTINADDMLNELMPTVLDSGHSRFPVVGDKPDEIIGILLAKDLLAGIWQKISDDFKLRDILRPVSIIPESKRLDTLLHEFRVKHNHMAIVVDEYGGATGLVTIEDVLEQIVGDIEDEHDFDDEVFIKPHGENIFIIKALTPIDEFNQYFNANFSDAEFDTIGGIVMKAFGYCPKRGEKITIDNFRFKILHADNRRIRLLRLWRNANS